MPRPAKQTVYDIAIVGAGSAGVWAAPFAAQLGARVALIERERIGGDCTWTGCVPSKALLEAASVAWDMRTAHRFGLDAVNPTVDLGRVMTSVQAAIDQIYAFETPAALESVGVDVYLGAARFHDPHTLLVGDETRVRARHVLLCTGARPSQPSIAGLDEVPYWTSETVWQQTRLPRHLLIIGGGPVGIELAQAFVRLGSDVTVFQRANRPLDVAEPEVSAIVQAVLEREGVRFRLGADVARAAYDGERIVLTDRGEDIEGDALLVAVGRQPTVDGLDLERAGVEFTDRGVQVDGQLRTSQRHIYACGDVLGTFQFTHYAAWQAAMAVRTILFPGSTSGVREHVPWSVFTSPEVAQCGLTEAAASERYSGDQIRVARWPLERLDRAVTARDVSGFIKIVHRPNDEILGAQVVAGRAGEIINELALAIEHRIKLGDLAGVMHVYPTYGIGVQQLASSVRLTAARESRTVELARRIGRIVDRRAGPS
jgi:pyruvate/2-oxoglutarate dehydrogenase complex dihydrolipoamide dehydrogenase (E3) component